MNAAAVSEDTALGTLMRVTMLDQPAGERVHWLKEVELALHGYGGERNARSVERVGNVLRDLTAEARTE